MKFFFCLAVLLLPLLPVAAQDFSRKPGKVTDYELKMTTYDQDTSAEAVILYEETNIHYAIHTNGKINQRRDYFTKIKILRSEGTQAADVEVFYYNSPGWGENVTVSGTTYNLENDKTVASPLKKEYIFTEQTSENNYKRKFSLPDVKVGSVIEYKYSIQSDLAQRITPVRFQHSYPLLFGYAKIAIPEYYKFNFDLQGYNDIEVTRTSQGKTFSFSGQPQAYTEDVLTCTAQNIPALRNDSYLWCSRDFLSMLNFELARYNFPGAMAKDYTTSWASVNGMLEQRDEFAPNLKMANPFKQEVADICQATNDESERVAAIHKMILSKVSWDGTYRLLSNDVKKAAGNASGSSAEINFLLIAALRDAGFSPTPILLNPRRYGRIPYTRPSVNKINTFIVWVTLSDGQQVFLDGTDKDSGVNLLPVALQVDRARIYGVESPEEGWVNLTNLIKNLKSTNALATLSPEGVLSGQMNIVYANSKAMELKETYRKSKDENEYIERREEEGHFEISEYTVSSFDSTTVQESYAFELTPASAGDRIFLNASIVPLMPENILSQQERKLPVEFSFPVTYIISCRIEIPEGYQVEETPANTRIAFDNGATFSYITARQGNTLAVNLVYNLNQVIFPTDEYTDLRNFFGVIAEKCNANIILKKI